MYLAVVKYKIDLSVANRNAGVFPFIASLRNIVN